VPDHCWPASWVVAFLLSTKGLIQVCTTSDNSDAAGTVPLLRGPSVRISFFTHGGHTTITTATIDESLLGEGSGIPARVVFLFQIFPFPIWTWRLIHRARLTFRHVVSSNPHPWTHRDADIARSVCSVRFLFPRVRRVGATLGVPENYTKSCSISRSNSRIMDTPAQRAP